MPRGKPIYRDHSDEPSERDILFRAMMLREVPLFEGGIDMSEQVYCVSTKNVLDLIGLRTGFISTDELDSMAGSTIDRIVDGLSTLLEIPGSFIPRSECEEDPTYLQLIPYCPIIRGAKHVQKRVGERGVNHIYTYLRNRKSGEGRLHSLRSLGIGGHINLSDLGPDLTNPVRPHQMVLNGAVREITEELDLRPQILTSQIQPIGIIYDPSNAVGSVHLGLIFRIFLRPYQEVTKRDVGADENCFKACDSLLGQTDEYESWSKLLIPIIDRW